MKQIKLTTWAIVMMSCMSCVAQGIYFVSGGDFRLPALQYDVKTDTNEQTTNVTPKMATNPSTFKTDGQEASFTSGTYATYKYPSAGVHKVKIYNNYPGKTTYQFGYSSTPSHIGGTLVVSGNTLVDASWLAVTNLIFNNVTSLRQGGFQMCRKIQSIKFNGVAPSELPTKVFAFCGDTGANGGFKEMDIPNEVRTIGHGVFTQCGSLKTLRLKNVQMTIDDSIQHTQPKNFTSVFRKCPIQDIYFNGSLEDWNQNGTYVRVFGAASTEANQDGTYTLQYSEYAQAIHAQADDPYYTWGSAAETDRPQNDLFANNSQNGNIKLHVNAQ